MCWNVSPEGGRSAKPSWWEASDSSCETFDRTSLTVPACRSRASTSGVGFGVRARAQEQVHVGPVSRGRWARGPDARRAAGARSRALRASPGRCGRSRKILPKRPVARQPERGNRLALVDVLLDELREDAARAFGQLIVRRLTRWMEHHVLEAISAIIAVAPAGAVRPAATRRPRPLARAVREASTGARRPGRLHPPRPAACRTFTAMSSARMLTAILPGGVTAPDVQADRCVDRPQPFAGQTLRLQRFVQARATLARPADSGRR